MPPELKSYIVYLTDFSQYKLIWLREASQYKKTVQNFGLLSYCFYWVASIRVVKL